MSTKTKSKGTVLIFAYHFPPENAIGGARPFRFAKYLSRLGYNCRVFTAAEQFDRNDPDTEYIPDPFIKERGRGLAWQLERAVRKVLFPGELCLQWSYRAYKAAREYVRANSGAQVTIFSTFPPLGAHLAGWQLSRTLDLRWIADFRDPLADGLVGVSGLRNRLRRALERFLLERADLVIANTDSALARWKSIFPSVGVKSRLIWNGFDPEDGVRPLPIPPRDYKALVHVGELYNGRTATPIIDSIARLIAEGRLRAKSLRVRLIGPADARSLPIPEFVRHAEAQGWLDIINNQVSQQEAHEITQTADYLLLLQPQSRTQVPGKLFEYLRIGRPILALIQPNSPSERLLKASGVRHECVYPDSNSIEIDDAVARLCNLPSTPVAPSPWFEQELAAGQQSAMLDALIHSIHSRDQGPAPGA